MGVSGQFHTPEKERGNHRIGGCVGFRASLDIFGGRDIAHTGIWTLDCLPVATRYTDDTVAAPYWKYTVLYYYLSLILYSSL